MAAKSMEEIRALLLAKKDGNGGGAKKERAPDSFLAFWNIPDRQALNLRFLPDADPTNPFFWRERDMINLPFAGVKGVHTDKVVVSVPCNEMWDKVNTCPVLKEVRKWWDDKDMEEIARTYWKKKSYLMQCLVAPNSVEVKDDKVPENPIRRVLVTKQLFAKIESMMVDPDMEVNPTDYAGGVDFRVIKSKNSGGFNSYDESKFAMKSRALNEEELAAIEKYGTFNLNDFMPKRPTPEELQAIADMFESSLKGEAYDPDRFAQFYRPAGVNRPNPNGATQSTGTAQTSTASTEQAPAHTTTSTATGVEAASPAHDGSTAEPAEQSALLARLRAQRGG